MDTIVDLRSRVLKLINSADDKLLHMIQILVETYQSEDNREQELTESQKKELDKRLERYARGETRFYTWEEVEAKLDQSNEI